MTDPAETSSRPDREWTDASRLRRLLRWLEVDRAVFFAITTRGWQLLAGPITLVLIAHHFAAEVQGYYYTFWSIIGLQAFFDLNLYLVISVVASHEWQKLALAPDGSITGSSESLSRLVSLGRLTAGWYAVAGVLFAIVVGCAGWLFFSWRESQANGWQGPWFALLIASAIALATTPLLGILEGCNQVAAVYRLHFIRAVAGNFAVWVCIPLGAGLWTPAIAVGVRLLCEFHLVGIRYRRFFAVFLRRPSGPAMNWFTEIWPMQWRVGLRGLFNYFHGDFVIPVIFHYSGAAAAGQMGMTWQVMTSLYNASAAWIRTRTPRFGMLVSQRAYSALDRLYFRVTTPAVAVLALALGLFWCFVAILYAVEFRYAVRLLPPLPTALLAVAMCAGLISDSQWNYIHAHKRSPFMRLGIAASLTTGFLVWLLGSRYGATGIGIAFVLMNGCFYLPVWTWAWRRCRSQWHESIELE